MGTARLKFLALVGCSERAALEVVRIPAYKSCA
jgi:hypothetical protein